MLSAFSLARGTGYIPVPAAVARALKPWMAASSGDHQLRWQKYWPPFSSWR